MIRNTIIQLEYSNRQRLFHFADQNAEERFSVWTVISNQVDQIDAEKFCDFMDKKYVNGRKSGQLPSVDIVLLEFQLFFKLEGIKRNLVNN